MSKIRIYELARELGVDNRIVIQRAIELGFQGKNSHSNSLESDEADQLRRSILRQAMGGSSNVVKRVTAQAAATPSETITTRVDRSTGQAESIVERRQGNVIMRRRQQDVAAPSAPEKAPQEVEASTATSSLEDLFHTPSSRIEASQETQDDEEIESPEEEFSNEAQTEDEETPLAEEELESSELEETLEQDEEPSNERDTPLEPSDTSIVRAHPAVTEEKRTGPRVLGRIELPVRKTKPTELRKPTGVVGGVPTTPVVDEEEEKKRKGLSKVKSRKREISRGDLIDYDGRDGKKGGRSSRRGQDIQRERVQPADIKGPKASKRVVKIDESLSVGELARQMSLKSSEVISKLIGLGVLATINQLIDKDTATLIAEDFGYLVESTTIHEKEFITEETPDDDTNLVSRPPVVTVMGHVDHGKTSLLDRIRLAAVAEKEAGGITQHIGAYSVALPDSRTLTFIDTPGHAAFTSMRARGAKVTDVVILVVAADDGVMPQTIEAISHAKAAGVPIVVAVNKMDKQDANPDRVKQQLADYGLQPESWGGDTMFFHVSALKGTGIQELLEGVLLQAEVLELRANPDRRGKGAIIESRQDRGRGTVATVLVQTGTLKVGDIFVAGAEPGRIRAMIDHTGKKIEKAGPSMPVEITGLNGIPQAGDDFFVVESDAQARQISDLRKERLAKEDRASASGPMTLEEFARRANNTAAAELNVILKTDVHGSLEAVKASLEQLSTEKVKVKVIHASVGGINESDIQLAVASKAIVIGFGVRGEPRAMSDAERYGIDVRFYKVIYELLDEVKLAMVGLLDPVKQEVFLGRAEVRETFTIPRIGTIAGSYVIDGTIKRGSFARVVRESRVVYEGKMSSLRRFKDDVKEVQRGYECGIGVENFNDVKVGDLLEIFEQKEVAAEL